MGKKHLLTSEIIASGSTFKAVFETLPRSIEKWTVFSAESAYNGLSILSRLAMAHGVRASFFANCFIGYTDNGTDIPFFHKSAIMPAYVEESLRRSYGNELFEAIPCCIGDGGRRFCYPEKHYRGILDVYSGMNLKEKKSRLRLEKILRETEGFLKECEKGI